MIQVLEGVNFTDAQEFVQAINKARLGLGKSWMVYQGIVAGKDVAIKSYGTGYLQILRVDGINSPPPMDINVGQWKQAILDAIS